MICRAKSPGTFRRDAAPCLVTISTRKGAPMTIHQRAQPAGAGKRTAPGQLADASVPGIEGTGSRDRAAGGYEGCVARLGRRLRELSDAAIEEFVTSVRQPARARAS